MSVLAELAKKYQGESVEWRQKGVIANHQYVSGGACAQFCAIWIKDHKWQVNFSTDLSVLDDAQWIKTRSSVDDYLKAYGFVKLKLPAAASDFKKPSSAAILGIVKAGPGFYLLTMSDVKGDGKVANEASKVHSVAFIHMRNNLQFFDPNFGIARFKTAEDLSQFFVSYGPRVLHHYTGSGYIEKYCG